MNKRKIWKIFDSTVKILFSEPQYLVQFLQAVLPPALVKSTDWNAISVLSGMLPDSSGMSERPIYADLIVQLPQVGDAPEKICSIIEIKSDDVRGYEKQLSDYSHSAQRKHPQCELIACVLFYCGRKPWNPSEQTGLSEGAGDGAVCVGEQADNSYECTLAGISCEDRGRAESGNDCAA